MKIDKKVNVYNTTASFIIFSIILALAIVGMFMFLNLMGRNTTYPELETTTTTETASEYHPFPPASYGIFPKQTGFLKEHEIQSLLRQTHLLSSL